MFHMQIFYMFFFFCKNLTRLWCWRAIQNLWVFNRFKSFFSLLEIGCELKILFFYGLWEYVYRMHTSINFFLFDFQLVYYATGVKWWVLWHEHVRVTIWIIGEHCKECISCMLYVLFFYDHTKWRKTKYIF